MEFKKSYAIAALLVVTVIGGYGAYVWHEYSELKEQRYSKTSGEVKAKLAAYEALPTVEGLRDIAALLDEYTTPVGGMHRGEVQALNAKIKSALEGYCTDKKCTALQEKQSEYEAEMQTLKDLRAPLDAEGVKSKTFVCYRIFERDGGTFSVECGDPRVLTRIVLLVGERTAKKIGLAGTYIALDVKDAGIQEVTLRNGSKEFVQYYKEVSVDWDAVQKSKEKISGLETELASLKEENSRQLAERWSRISKSVDPDLKQVASLFNAPYGGLSKAIAESVGLEAPKRQVEDHPVSGVLFHYDSDDAANFEGPWHSTIQADGKPMVSYDGILQHGDALEGKHAGMLAYVETSGGKSCDSFVYKGVVVTKGKELKLTPTLGHCDTKFTVDADTDVINSESADAKIKCNIHAGMGQWVCKPTRT